MRLLTLTLIGFLAVLLTPIQATHAQLQPHNFTDFCGECHSPHGATGATLTDHATNTALCMSCHDASGPHPDVLPNKQLADSDQALPGPGLPAGVNASGTSHRWDSGASGWVEADDLNTSDGTVSSGGAFTGVYAKTYTITIASMSTLMTPIPLMTPRRGVATRA
jgi:predicted CXXCH cytochrome family protein